ncbi:MAG: Uma2 family endonuclease [Leptolyngbya sp. SIO4C1]|nr:Uma2 family endonuclease [Leptolyngbya sp. SIO4C1]
MVTFFRRQSKLKLPPLENGDRLSRSEFEHRYVAMPDVKKAELIEGTVYMASPLRFEPHAEPHADLMGWLWTYRVATPGARLGDNPTVRIDRDNELQPDVVLRLDEKLGGQSFIDADGYLAGAPEFIAEIAASTATIDLGDKLKVYRRSGVKEYLVWQFFDEKIDWYRLEGDEYVEITVDSAGTLKSQIFPGLWLDREAMILGNMPRVMEGLQTGLNTSAHKAFLSKLACLS